MKFISTRGKCFFDNASMAIVKGLADDGGLCVPEFFPCVKENIVDMLSMDYAERAAFILSKYLDEYDYNGLLNACKKAYSKFEDSDPAPLIKIDDKTFIMELFHGPTLAFKDVALTILPYLLSEGAKHIGIKEEILILVATSGDTGKAALEGFKDQKGVKINVFFPNEGVSDMQKMQMCTQEGNNVNVVAVKGNFDDCQTAVKKIFGNSECAKILKEKNIILSSANSINFGRLAPQIVYYFSAYCDLVNNGTIKIGDKIDFVVPTGNFGNILAGYYAKQMGLPINKLICASNSNNVLTEFISCGNYDANREFFKTMSPSMDILVSSNLERLVFELSNRDADLTKKRMEELKNTGTYQITEKELKNMQADFSADYSEEEDCLYTIYNVFDEYGYVLDPHTSVAMNAALFYKEQSGNKLNTVILSTASPYKFTQSVLKALTEKTEKDAFKASQKLYNETAMEIPKQISELKNKTIRFSKVCEKDKTFDAILEYLDK